MCDSPRVIRLRHVKSVMLRTTADFNFRLTLWKPSYFSTGLEIHTINFSWRTFRIHEYRIGARLQQVGAAAVRVDIYADGKLSHEAEDRVIWRIISGYGLADELSEFFEMIPRSRYYDQIGRLRGMRVSCPESIFEITILSLLLQNTTISRTTQMLRSLLTHYGAVVRFDGVTLRIFFTPEELAGIPEGAFRLHDRVGCRGKYFPAISVFFSSWSEPPNRAAISVEQLMQELRNISGIGPYSAGIIAAAALRDNRAVPLDVWNTRLLARALFGQDDSDPGDILRCLGRTFPGFEGLAALYFIESYYLEKPLDPLQRSVAQARLNSLARIRATLH